MPKHDSSQSPSSDAEELLVDILFAVRGACKKLDYYPDQSEIDGLVSRIALKLFDKDGKVLHSFEQRSGRRTWLFTIAGRVVQRRIRSRKRMVNLKDAPPESFIIQPDHEERLFSRELWEKLLEAFSHLTEHEQKLLCLWLQGFSTEGVAKEMGIKKESVYREKSALKKKIQRISRGK